MAQTQTSFSDKWSNNQNSFYEDLFNENSEITRWVLNRNGFSSLKDFGTFLQSKKRILDAGCGNGRITNLMAHLTNTPSEVVGIDFSSWKVAKENLEPKYNHVKIYEANLREKIGHIGKFDYIYCQEVLHHTGDAEASFYNLVDILDNNGEIAIYVYKKKAPTREFVDDYIRDRIKSLSYDEAMKVSEKISDLGKELSSIQQKITVPDIEVLGIEAGEYTVQRFIYHYFMKCFWNDGLSHHENTVINYDWYHPEDCTRHTLEEVKNWYKKANLTVTHEVVDHYGITVRGTKN